MSLRLASLLTCFALCSGVVFAQDAPPDPAPAEGEKPEDEGVEKAKEKADEKVNSAKQNLAQARLAVETAQKALDASTQRVTALEGELKTATQAREQAEQGVEVAEEALSAADEAGKAKAQQDLDAAKATLTQAQAAETKAEEELEQAQATVSEAEDMLETAQDLLGELTEDDEAAAFRKVAAEAAAEALAAAKAQERSAEVDTAKLALQMLPLTQAQLEAEAEAWRLVLEEDVSAISYTEIALKTAEGEKKNQIAQALTELREERTALIDRLEVVLKELENKGGDPKPFRDYAKAVSGVFSNLDATDVSATWTAVVGWAKSPEGGLRILKNLILALITLIVFKMIASVLGGLVTRALNSSRFKTPELLRNFFVGMARKTVFAIGIVMALSMLEVDITPFIAALGGAVIVVGLALQGTLSNFAAGILIILYRPYDVGNVVKVAGEAGKVEAMNLMSTTLLTPDNQLVVVPNGAIWGGVITNITGKSTRRVDLVFGVGYGDDLAKTEETLKEILEQHEKVLKDPAPVIQVHELADSSVNFVCRPWCNTADYWDVYWDISRKVKDTFDERGISIPFPQRDLHVYSETAAGAES